LNVLIIDPSYELRRFPFAAETPAFMLPVVQRTLLERTLAGLARCGLVRPILISTRNIAEDHDLSCAVVDHELDLARSVPQALDRLRRSGRLDQPLLLLRPNLHPLPSITRLVVEHMRGSQQVSLVRGTASYGPGQYGFGPPVFVLGDASFARLLLGYEGDRPLAEAPRFARKHGLPVAVLDAGVSSVEINNPFALFQANLETLAQAPASDLRGLRRLGPRLWAAADARVEAVDVDPSGGPVIVGSGSVLAAGSTLRGPSIFGRSVTLEGKSFVHRGLILDRTELGAQSFVARSVVSPFYKAAIAA
jgi:hypothetical protein